MLIFFNSTPVLAKVDMYWGDEKLLQVSPTTTKEKKRIMNNDKEYAFKLPDGLKPNEVTNEQKTKELPDYISHL